MKKKLFTPNFKLGIKNNVGNYRLISKIVFNSKDIRINFLQKFNRVIYLKSVSVILSMWVLTLTFYLNKPLIYQSDLLNSFEHGHQIDTITDIYTICIDFQKVFDKMNHALLLYKLKSFGVCRMF